jgi:hypothetical protein
VTVTREELASHAPRAGLCTSCVHQQTVTSVHGSVFSLCRRALTDAAFPKYPPLPVTRCPGYEAVSDSDQKSTATSMIVPAREL